MKRASNVICKLPDTGIIDIIDEKQDFAYIGGER
jgi:hypothetical protein